MTMKKQHHHHHHHLKAIRCVSKLVAGLMLLLVNSLAQAELRVLIEYDSDEHRLIRIVELESDALPPVSDHLSSNVEEGANTHVQLRWFDADGSLIHSESMADPRLTHAPLTGTDQAPVVVGLSEGAYMVSGPSGSAVLEIHLPAISALELDMQVWRITLDY